VISRAAHPDRVIRLNGVTKNYGGLRPLRIQSFELEPAQTVALIGLDRAAAEVLVNLITAATLPDSGDVETFGSPTHLITDSDTWFRSLDKFGIVSSRNPLVDELRVEQNLALPLTLDVGDMSPDLRRHAGRIAEEVGIAPGDRTKSMAAADATMRMRVRLGKALALDPAVLIAEHPNAEVPPDEVGRLAAVLKRLAASRGIAMLVLTADQRFAAAVASRVLMLNPSTGELLRAGGWFGWLGGRAR
jgi:ABC-type transporter Mla maintaining outer membrane lipid asymmetry ATPase subunit MlaF